MAIVTNGRLEYEMSAIDVTYPDIGKVTYRGSYPLIVSNQWAPPSKMPVKGDLIMLDGKQYRVLKINDTVAEVLAMYDAGKSIFGKSLTYENSTLDKYCNENFYNSLSAKLQNAIISKNFKQDEWSWKQGTTGASGNPIYYGTHLNKTMQSQNYQVGLVSSNFGVDIIRNCYCISVQDVLDYLNVTAEMDATTTTLTGINVLKMFTASIDTLYGLYIPLRSAQYTPDSQYLFAFMIDCRDADINTSMISNTFNVRPAFQIDLSKVDWVKV